ncbi:type II secretion system protein N [Comamonas flocculans]|uniref:Type II secretion system protein GspC N-terminal domain-containing protein n=1 Tax=Comamonas flocculans TaxID=2597701 RepID=A0A5B8RZB1_9BURK|nr:type II secretion system protein N [Comamonas flocculans]QEA13237.1 hypothetical protein FOZ74_09460 [Comamonas flocculans]
MEGVLVNGRAVRWGLALTLLFALLVLASMWFGRQGELRNMRWQAPETIAFDAAQWNTHIPARTLQAGELLQTLERPLFSPLRRPPPPPPPPQKEDTQAATLTDMHLYGLYGSGSTGGAIVRVDGKDQRLSVNENIKGWKLVRVGDDSITLRRGGQERTLQLVHVILVPDKAAAAASVRRTPGSRSSGGSGNSRAAPAAAAVPRDQEATPQGTASAEAAAAADPAQKPSAPPHYSGPKSFVKPAPNP